MEKGKFDIRINENQRYIDLLNEGNVVVNEVSSNNLPILDPYSDDFEKYFPMGDYHTYITGQTRMGKSTLLTILFHRYIQRTNSNVILFDVHGDLAKKAKMLVKDKSRLLYISNTLDKSHAASINLFKLNDKSEKNISKMANVILGVIKQVKTDEAFSGAMEELLLRCIRILLRKSDGSFRELYRFTNDKRNSDLVEYAKKCGDILDEEYFQDYFNDTNTKNAVRRRLSTLLNDEDFINMMSGDKCIDFEKEFNTPNKIIIIDISKGSMDSYIYYIRFIIEYISILALKRVDTPKEERVITHLILDEFDNFISSKGNIKTILKEAGKYNLLLTIAHQIISDIKDSSLRDILFQ
jgi:type IV secretory pathway VirB4 component